MLGREVGVDFSTTGIMQQAIHLSPYIPNQLIKLGAKGVLSVRLVHANDPVPLPGSIISQGTNPFRGLLVQHFPAATPTEIVSVNGVGDTFLGVFLGNLSQSKASDKYEKNIVAAQKAACLTLASSESVSPEIRVGKNRALRVVLNAKPNAWAIYGTHIIKPEFDGVERNLGR